MDTLKLILTVSFLVSSQAEAQCSLPQCQAMKSTTYRYQTGATPVQSDGLVFVAPQSKWPLRPSLRVATVIRESDFWLTPEVADAYFPGLQFIRPRRDFSTRTLVYQSQEGNSAMTQCFLGFHRKPKGFGLVWQRSF